VGKLHEVLAVEKDARNAIVKILAEGKKTFESRSAHFLESRKTYTPYNAEDTDLLDEEFTPMVTTVKEKLDHMQGYIVHLMDLEIQKETANQEAKADIIVEKDNGERETLITEVPVTMLVQMENLLQTVRMVYDAAPTIDPAKVWTKDPNTENVFVAERFTRVRTKKVPEVIVKHEGNDKHPPQTELFTMDKGVGTWTHSARSGALSPKQKSQLLKRIDKLIAAVKIARAKANETEVKSIQMGNKIFAFINEGFKY